jgi:hypothetical protein
MIFAGTVKCLRHERVTPNKGPADGHVLPCCACDAQHAQHAPVLNWGQLASGYSLSLQAVLTSANVLSAALNNDLQASKQWTQQACRAACGSPAHVSQTLSSSHQLGVEPACSARAASCSAAAPLAPSCCCA